MLGSSGNCRGHSRQTTRLHLPRLPTPHGSCCSRYKEGQRRSSPEGIPGMLAKDIMTSPLGEAHEGAWPYLQGLDQFLTHGTYETYAAPASYRMVRGFC